MWPSMGGLRTRSTDGDGVKRQAIGRPKCVSVGFHEETTWKRQRDPASLHSASSQWAAGQKALGRDSPQSRCPLPECGDGATRDKPVGSVHKIGYNYPLLFLLSVKKLPMWGGGAVCMVYCN